MKISLLTLHSQNNNFGSVLQAYSLYSYLEEKGHDVTVLNYQPYYSNGAVNLRAAIKKIITNTLFLPHYIKRSRKFNEILKREKITEKYTKYSELKKIGNEYDVYMIGSDQVWNPNYLCGNDPSYNLEFSDSPNKIAYAASIGTADLSEEQFNEIAQKVKDFKHISLREKASSVSMKNSGREDAEFVLDPVFLHTADYYRNLQKDNSEKGYILAYIIHKDPFMEEVVDALAKRLGKRVVQVGGFASKCNYDYFDRSAGPRDFLGLIDNADFVITSSFHGLAFSHIYKKQFAVVMPHSNTLRLENILEAFCTQDRVITDIKDLEKVLNNDIDYSKVDVKIDSLRKKSFKFLEKALEE